MSMLIDGKMPKNCAKCPYGFLNYSVRDPINFCEHYDIYCVAMSKHFRLYIDEFSGRPEICPMKGEEQ